MKLPPYGQQLVERQKWENRPFFVVVCVGLGAWLRAKNWQQSPNDISSLVLPDKDQPDKYTWPVKNCLVFIERLQGPGDEDVFALVKELLISGAERVIVWNKYGSEKIISFWAGETEC